MDAVLQNKNYERALSGVLHQKIDLGSCIAYMEEHRKIETLTTHITKVVKVKFFIVWESHVSVVCTGAAPNAFSRASLPDTRDAFNLLSKPHRRAFRFPQNGHETSFCRVSSVHAVPIFAVAEKLGPFVLCGSTAYVL